MAEIALGRMAFNDKGIHSLTTEYRKWDFVTSTDSTYLYINETAKKGEPLNNAAYWKCLADGKPATLAAAAANEKSRRCKPSSNSSQRGEGQHTG